jgi:hypothetical protein
MRLFEASWQRRFAAAATCNGHVPSGSCTGLWRVMGGLGARRSVLRYSCRHEAWRQAASSGHRGGAARRSSQQRSSAAAWASTQHSKRKRAWRAPSGGLGQRDEGQRPGRCLSEVTIAGKPGISLVTRGGRSKGDDWGEKSLCGLAGDGSGRVGRSDPVRKGN